MSQMKLQIGPSICACLSWYNLNFLPITLLIVKTDSASTGQWERWKWKGGLVESFASARAADPNVCSGHSYPCYAVQICCIWYWQHWVLWRLCHVMWGSDRELSACNHCFSEVSAPVWDSRARCICGSGCRHFRFYDFPSAKPQLPFSHPPITCHPENYQSKCEAPVCVNATTTRHSSFHCVPAHLTLGPSSFWHSSQEHHVCVVAVPVWCKWSWIVCHSV